jgi:Flagellar hook-length control protein FliK
MDIGAALKQQMLGVLIDALGKPASGAAQSAVPAALKDLPPGAALSATVVSVRPDGRLVLQIKGQTAPPALLQAEIRGAAVPEAARQPGTVLQLKVETAGQTPRLSFVAVDSPPAPQASNAAPQASAPATAAVRNAAPLGNIRPASISPQLAPDPVTHVIARAATQAAAHQGSAAPLYADLAALTARPDNDLPRPLVALAQALLASRLDGERPIGADDLRQAVARSGILQEASLARGEPAPLDTKALLTSLRDMLRGDGHPAPHPADAEPPRRDGAVSAQKPVQAQIAAETDPKAIVATLAREADHAVERLKLHQIASLPEQRAAGPDHIRPQQLNFELPIAFGQQTAMAGFRIEREKRRNREHSQPVDVWGVRFAIDADVLGPVHAHVRLTGDKVSVSLWAEDAATRSAFTAAMPMLEAALADNALDIGDLMIFAGRPAEPARPAAGHFLDRTS